MIITKFEHACFVVELDGKSLIVDPGVYTTDLVIPDNTVAIVITHEHPDHFDLDTLATIYNKCPESLLVSTSNIIDKVSDYQSKVVKAGDKVQVGPFSLEFFGGEHAVIMPALPVIPNVAVMINEQIYYPGDSFSKPNHPVEILALPVSAPWLKVSETIEFLQAIKPKLAFPTHDAVLSDTGKSLIDNLLPTTAKAVGTEYQRIRDSIEI